MIRNIDLSFLSFERLYRAYLNMDSRQQTIALIGAAVAVILVITLPLAVAKGKLSSMKRRIGTSKEQVYDVVRNLDRFNEAKARLAKAERLLGEGYDSAISTTLETLAARNNIQDKIDSLKEKPPVPSELMEEVTVDVRLRSVTLPQTVSFLYDIEHQPDKLLRLKKLEVKPRYGNNEVLNVNFEVSTFKIGEELRD